MLERLLKKIAAWCERTDRVQYITGTTPNDVYLIRYLVINARYLKIYIHIFFRSDKDDPHDHPWNFWTRIVRGSYTEETFKYDSSWNLLRMRSAVRSTVSQCWAGRKATDVHRVMLDRDYSLAEKDIAPMTLFFAGKWQREWGFIRKRKPIFIAQENGRNWYRTPASGMPCEWVPWKTYLGLPPNFKARS